MLDNILPWGKVKIGLPMPKPVKMQILIKILASAIIFLMVAFDQAAAKPRKLTDEAQVAMVKNIRTILFVTHQKIRQCLNNNESNKHCNCKYEKNFKYLNMLADKMFKEYPAWQNDTELRYLDDKKVKSLMPQELKRRINFKTNCISYLKF